MNMKIRSSAIICMVMVTWLCFSGIASAAAPPPDAGRLMQEGKPQRRLPGALPVFEGEPPASRKNMATSVTVTVRHFRFVGFEEFAGEKELQSVVAGYIGQQLHDAQLQEVTDLVTAWLRKQGWFLAKAYYPEQILDSGTVTIAVGGGKSDNGITVERDHRVRMADDRLERFAEDGAHAGKPVRRDDVERSVLLIKELPGMDVRAIVSPGEYPGTSSVRFKVSEDKLVSGILWTDNFGNRYTGIWRGSTELMLNDPLRIGDRLKVDYAGSESLSQGKISYEVPVLYDGLKAHASWQGLNFKLMKQFESLDYKGSSSVVEGGLSYPFFLARESRVMTGVVCRGKHSIDEKSGLEQSDRHTHSGTLSLEGVNYDRCFGGGSTTWGASVTYGDFRQSNPKAHEDAVLNGSEGSFSYFGTNLSRAQRISDRLLLNAEWTAQFAHGNLDSGEGFYLGGPYGVRAYPSGEGGGDEGHLFNLDLRYQMPLPPSCGNFELSGFYDAGRITLHKERFPSDISTATGKNSYWLQGAGVGLKWVHSSKFVIHATWARTIGRNSGRDDKGMNSDGRDDRSRFWMQGLVYF
jgi:hemolysin activation/secretion protein